MGRLPALSGRGPRRGAALVRAGLAVGLLVAGCDRDGDKTPLPPPPTSRREAVAAKPGSPTAGTTASAPPSARPTVVARRLCDGQLAQPGRPFPNKPVSHAEAAGAPPLGDAIPVGGGRWTWLSLWAAWCAPCKEEMPRLRGWEDRLGKAGTPMAVLFLSLDDDERELRKFLAAQPAGGVRASWWIEEGKMREEWLGAARLRANAQLPVQILVDPAGLVRCTIQGAVEDGDYAQVAAIVAMR